MSYYIILSNNESLIVPVRSVQVRTVAHESIRMRAATFYAVI